MEMNHKSPDQDSKVTDIRATFSVLQSALNELRSEQFTRDEDIDFLCGFAKNMGKLLEVNDRVALSQEFDQPEGSAIDVTNEMQAHSPCKDRDENELLTLLKKPHLQNLLLVHDKVRSRTYETPLPAFDPTYHPKTNYNHRRRNPSAPDVRTVGLHKDANETLGITLKVVGNRLVIARILYGGLIYRQGLLQVGDRIIEVNNEPVDNMTPSDLQSLLKHSSGSIVIKVEPGQKESAGSTDMYVKTHFDYIPRHDLLIPSQDVGLPFKKGDVLRVLNQDDSFWWQAVKHDANQTAGLVPSLMLEERRRAFNTMDGRVAVGCMGQKKAKKKIIYSSHHCGEFECYDMLLYEPVVLVDDFQFKTLVLIGAPNIGRRSLKTRLIAEYPDKYADVMGHTTRDIRSEEDRRNYHFVPEDEMRADIIQHKFIEFGKHRGTTESGKVVQHLYGIKSASVAEVVNDGYVCILDVHPQALKHLRTAQFCPLVVFIKAANADGVRRLHHSARVDAPGGFTQLSNEDFIKCFQESARIEEMYGHLFDHTIVNENIDVAYENLLSTIRLVSQGKRWVPSSWVI